MWSRLRSRSTSGSHGEATGERVRMNWLGWLAACASSLALACSPAGVTAPDSASVRSRADALLSSLHDRGLFNGVVVLGMDGAIVYEKAWGPADVEAGVMLTPDTPMDGASLAKTFTAAAVWMLVEEGKLDLEAPVQRYVPLFPHQETKVRHLIEHSAGLGDWDEVDFLTNQLLVEKLRERGIPPQFPPGSRYSYSNAGYDVAALVIENVSGLTWDTFLRQRVFEPLDMRSTFLRPVRLADWQGTRTKSYRREAGKRVLLDVFDAEAFYGSANLYFSARDLHRWATSFYARPVLKPTTLASGLEPANFGSNESSALNDLSWYYAPDRRRFHFSGEFLGWRHEVYWDAGRRLSIVWMNNDLTARPFPDFLTRALVAVMEGRDPETTWIPDFGGPAKGASLAPVAGVYSVDGIGRVTIMVEGDRARLRIGYQAFHDCFGSDGFSVPDLGAEVGFSGLRDGRYRRLHWVSVFHSVVGERMVAAE